MRHRWTNRTSGWAWKRYLGTGACIIALVGLFARVESQVSIQPTTFASFPTTSYQPGRLWFSSDSWMVAQEQYNGSTSLNYFGPGNRKLTLPGALTGQTTTLNNGGDLTNVATSMTVTSDSGFPAVPYIVKIDSEYIVVTAKTGTNWSTIGRAYGNVVGETAAAASHTDGSTVTLINWMPVNIGTSTTNAAYGGINLIPQAVNGEYQWRAAVRIAPAAPYTITARFTFWGEHDGASGSAAGIGWREESTGKVNTVAAWDDTTYTGRLSWHTWAKLSNGAVAGLFLQKTLAMTVGPYALQLRYDGTNLSIWVSTDGSSWTQVHTNVAKNTYFTTAPDQIFFAAVNADGTPTTGSNQYVSGTLYSWEVQ